MIHRLACVGSPPEHRDYKTGDHAYMPFVHRDAKINAFVTIDCGIKGPTRVGRAFIMAGCHIGHDAVIGDGCELAPRTVIGGHAVLEENVRCGIGALVLPFKRVGKGARIGAGAVVTHDVPAGEVWCGNPAKQLVKRDPVMEGWDEWWDASRRQALLVSEMEAHV